MWKNGRENNAQRVYIRLVNSQSKVFLVRLLLTKSVCCLGYRSNNFIVGLTNTDFEGQAPVLWQYTLCDQYPGTVPDGATVSVQCTHACLSDLRFQYVIVQFPLVNDSMNFCEIKVFVLGKPVIIINRKIAHICTRGTHNVVKNR